MENEVYENIDVTELAWEQRKIHGIAMESLPAAARRVNQWVKKRSSKKDYLLCICQNYNLCFFTVKLNRYLFHQCTYLSTCLFRQWH